MEVGQRWGGERCQDLKGKRKEGAKGEGEREGAKERRDRRETLKGGKGYRKTTRLSATKEMT